VAAKENLVAAKLIALPDAEVVFPILAGCNQSLTDVCEISFGWVLYFLGEYMLNKINSRWQFLN
jgi:hypothetical protein